MLKDQQMHFGFMVAVLLHIGHQEDSANHVAICKVVRTRIQT